MKKSTKKQPRYRQDWLWEIRAKVGDLVQRNGLVAVLEALDDTYREYGYGGISPEDLRGLQKQKKRCKQAA